MWTAPFDPAQRTLYVDVLLIGPAASRWCTFIIDTGTQITLRDPQESNQATTNAHSSDCRPRISIAGAASAI